MALERVAHERALEMTEDAAALGWRIEPLGDRALRIAFEARVDPAINAAARAAAERLAAVAIEGIVDIVPAFCTVVVHYRPAAVEAGDGAPFARLASRIAAVLANADAVPSAPERVVEIPVCYGGAFGPDLTEVAERCGMTEDAVVAAHVASPHVVYMLGFSPGFPYVGGLDARLSLPRRSTPRTRIPAGSVAIAREQTAVYTFETPGGWNLIGRTPLVLFDPAADPPCLLRPGDRLRFVPVDAERYAKLNGEARSR